MSSKQNPSLSEPLQTSRQQVFTLHIAMSACQTRLNIPYFKSQIPHPKSQIRLPALI